MRNTTWLDGTNIAQTQQTIFRPHLISRFFLVGIVITFLTLAISTILSGLLQDKIEKPELSKSLKISSL